MNPRIVPLLILLLGFTACEESQTIQPPVVPVGEIDGAIYQRLFPEVPVAGAEVAWGEASSTSGVEGDYHLAPTTAGAGSLRVTHPDFGSESRWIMLD
ncbi:MAG: hypothetical protein GY946_30165, partial [bacterium]|nr:hypothetical protein [bacterium]